MTTNDTTLNSSLEQFFRTLLQEIYWSEQNLIDVLGTMNGAATAAELKESFNKHREQTREHIKRVEQVFGMLGQEPQAEPSAGLQGLFDEGWQVIDETQEGSAQRDVALIIAAQKVEHYEIACYGSIITLARTMQRNDIARILAPTLDEEKETDLRLTEIAEGSINADASQEPATA